jgi:L-ascorbate metabolism protein UlaG (beta-lactamase superfamily)
VPDLALVPVGVDPAADADAAALAAKAAAALMRNDVKHSTFKHGRASEKRFISVSASAAYICPRNLQPRKYDDTTIRRQAVEVRK